MSSDVSKESPGNASDSGQRRIYLVAYPKIVFLYPTLIAALIAGIYMAFVGNEPARDTYVVTLSFLAILAVNLRVKMFRSTISMAQ